MTSGGELARRVPLAVRWRQPRRLISLCVRAVNRASREMAESLAFAWVD